MTMDKCVAIVLISHILCTSCEWINTPVHQISNKLHREVPIAYKIGLGQSAIRQNHIKNQLGNLFDIITPIWNIWQDMECKFGWKPFLRISVQNSLCWRCEYLSFTPLVTHLQLLICFSAQSLGRNMNRDGNKLFKFGNCGWKIGWSNYGTVEPPIWVVL